MLPSQRHANEVEERQGDQLFTDPANVAFTNIPCQKTMTQSSAAG